MDSRGPRMYLHPGMSMMGESRIGSVPGSIPINVPMDNPTSEVTTSDVHMLGNHPNFSRKSEPNKSPEQHHYDQLPLREEIYDEGRISSAVVPETSSPLPTETSAHHTIEENDDGLEESSQQKVKIEDEEIENFMEAAHDIFLQISSKEITLKQGADKLGRPYSFVYTKYQEFCDEVTGFEYDKPKKKKKKTKKKKIKRRPKRLTMVKSNSRLVGEVYQCKECPATFNTEYLIKTHAKVHVEGNEAHLCTACGVVFSKLNKLMQHRVDSHDEALQCPHCDSRFTTIINYKSHILTHTGGKLFYCSECGKGFRQRYGLSNHKRSHTGERPYMCGICGKTFRTINGVKSHRYLHTGEKDKPFECELCGHRYLCNSALMDHMNTHTGAKPYSCDICDARYNFKANLMRHKMTHAGDGPHKCDLCPAAFYRPIDLKNHKVSHSGIKPYKCDLCDYACTRKSNMEFHKNTHTGETPFKCDFYGCNAEYARPNSLKKHKLKHGPPPPQTCKVCHEKFTDLIALKRHMVIHTGEKPHTCDQCFKTFVDVGALKRHAYTHMYRPLAEKTKQVRQSRKNPAVKKADTAAIDHRKWSTEYQVPDVSENGHISQGLPTSSQGMHTSLHGLSSSSHGLSSSSHGLHSSSHGLPSSSHGIPSNSHGLSSSSHGLSSSLHGMPSSIQGLPTVSQGLPTVSQGLPATSSQVLPTTVTISHQGWNINPEYTNLVNLNTAWPSTMDPDELRRRLLHSFK